MAVLESPIAGKVIAINVKAGDKVSPEDEPILLESMKMEIPVLVEEELSVSGILIEIGQSVNAGDPLLEY